MRNKLEKSHHTILLLENKVRNVGQSDSNLVDMMRKVREASEAELRRFMEETDAKYNLNVCQIGIISKIILHIHVLHVQTSTDGQVYSKLKIIE